MSVRCRGCLRCLHCRALGHFLREVGEGLGFRVSEGLGGGCGRVGGFISFARDGRFRFSEERQGDVAGGLLGIEGLWSWI